ncbi:hypothetical protein ACGF12_14035 [Kitasatospora sp. NPDC048296]|uniref:hypothetical protein n=1 Tax=Kitasatospora sp. NPDC048296 TaxID=3364048 RepID=UPI00371FE6E5
MPKNSSAGRREAIKHLKTELGLTHSAAARIIDGGLRPPRLVLSDEILALGRGEGLQRNCRTDWAAWLKKIRLPGAVGRYTCHWCDEPGNPQTTDTSVTLLLSRYDPDLNPYPGVLAVHSAHHACAPSAIRWAVPAAVPQEPAEVELSWAPLDGDGRPDEGQAVYAVYRPYVAPLLADHDGRPTPILRLYTQQLAGLMGSQQQEQLWQDYVREELGLGMDGGDAPYGWTARIEHRTGSSLAPSWIALRTCLEDGGQPARSLYTAVTALTDDWVAAACALGEVLVISTARPWGPDGAGAGADALLRRFENGEVPGGWVPLCEPTTEALDAWADARAQAEQVMS